MEFHHSGYLQPKGQNVMLVNLFFWSLPFLIPLAIGYHLLASRGDDLSLMAGLLTLKPIITTPIWVAIISLLQGSGVGDALIALCSILPGASLTILALLRFRPLFQDLRATPARMLIVLDCMRWINSGLLAATGSISYYDAIAPLTCIFALIGLLFPSAYSLVALTTTLVTNER